MAAEEDKSSDFYGVMGLKKECSPAELRNAYKKLAMKWHPDKFSASGNPKYVEEAKRKFQDIQQAYSVLSDANKRFLYDVGVYGSDDDDDENGMDDFLSEMAAMMSQNKSNEKRNESFEDLQDLFQEIFHNENDVFASSSRSTTPTTRVSSSQDSCIETANTSNKRNYSETSSSNFSGGFCIGENTGRAAGERRASGGGGSSRRDGRKQKISTGQDVSSRSISA